MLPSDRGTPLDVRRRFKGGFPGVRRAAEQAAKQTQEGTQATPILFPPDVIMPAEGSPIYRSAQAAIAGPGSWVIPAAMIQAIPGGSIGVIKVFAVNIVNMLTTTLVTYQLRVNGAAVPGLGVVTLAARAGAYVEQESVNLTVRAPENAQVDVVVTVADAVAYTVGARFEGWYYPRDVAERYRRGLAVVGAL